MPCNISNRERCASGASNMCASCSTTSMLTATCSGLASLLWWPMERGGRLQSSLVISAAEKESFFSSSREKLRGAEWRCEWQIGHASSRMWPTAALIFNENHEM